MPDLAAVKDDIEAAWEQRESLSSRTEGGVRRAVDKALELLDSGRFRVAEKVDGEWVTHQWLKKAVLLSFRLNDNQLMGAPTGALNFAGGGGAPGPWWDKVPVKWGGWGDKEFREAGFRAVPGAVVRRGAFIGRNVVLMPSFVNIGAYVGEGTMVDTWATVGSCAQIGRNVHLSGGAGIGGVLEPLQASPTIIEDGCFIGARAEVAEGVIVGEGRRAGHGRLLVGLNQDRGPGHGRDPSRAGPALLRGRAGLAARPERRPEPLLRRHRQAGGRPDPGQNRGQRAAAGVAARSARPF
jgi:2,3,4,5-tetrahydropyridine-2-carboxylate N-succinyltransferase